jgi:hypothetical protein
VRWLSPLAFIAASRSRAQRVAYGEPGQQLGRAGQALLPRDEMSRACLTASRPPLVCLHAYTVKDIPPEVYVRGMFCAHKRGEKIPAKSAQTCPSHCNYHMLSNCRSPALRWSRRLRNVALHLADLEWILAPPPPAWPSSAAGSGRAFANDPMFGDRGRLGASFPRDGTDPR